MESRLNVQEKEPRILGKVSIMRHAATKYTDQFPDVTEKGVEQSRERGKELKSKIDRSTDDVLFASSSSVRTRGTMSFILEELGEEDADVRTLESIRSVEIRDMGKARVMIDEIMEGTGDVAKMDRAYANDERFENTPDIWQSKSEVEKRFYRGLEYLIRSFIKYQKIHKNEKTPHLVAVSHFEFLNHFVAKVFNLDLKKDDLLGFTEMVEMEIREPVANKPNEVPIRIFFRGQNKDIIFNREERLITI